MAVGYAAVALREANAAPRDEQMADYLAQLEEHIALWPNRPQANTARWWLARHRITQQRWREALQLLTEVSADSPPF